MKLFANKADERAVNAELERMAAGGSWIDMDREGKPYERKGTPAFLCDVSRLTYEAGRAGRTAREYIRLSQRATTEDGRECCRSMAALLTKIAATHARQAWEAMQHAPR